MPVTAEGDFAIVIPARFASSRFPGKPLTPLLGKPMIRHVWERCVQAVAADNVFVATDDARIRAACGDFGARVLMTGSGCLTGTDRVAEAAGQIGHAFVVNVQGDEPMLDPADILAVAATHRAHPRAVVNAMAPIEDERDYRSRNVPKVLAAPDGRLLYMSRAPVPADKGDAFRGAQRQVCIYAFSREHLARFAACPVKTPLEAIEDIEILRFLELGIEVRMVTVACGSLAVDTPEDVKRVEHALRGA